MVKNQGGNRSVKQAAVKEDNMVVNNGENYGGNEEMVKNQEVSNVTSMGVSNVLADKGKKSEKVAFDDVNTIFTEVTKESDNVREKIEKLMDITIYRSNIEGESESLLVVRFDFKQYKTRRIFCEIALYKLDEYSDKQLKAILNKYVVLADITAQDIRELIYTIAIDIEDIEDMDSAVEKKAMMYLEDTFTYFQTSKSEILLKSDETGLVFNKTVDDVHDAYVLNDKYLCIPSDRLKREVFKKIDDTALSTNEFSSLIKVLKERNFIITQFESRYTWQIPYLNQDNSKVEKISVYKFDMEMFNLYRNGVCNG